MESQDSASRKDLFCVTPLLESLVLQKKHLPGVPVFLKLENTQPTGSFKIRGLSRVCEQALRQGYNTVVTSSAGNAGLAVAYSARRLGIRARVYVTERTDPAMVEPLLRESAEIVAYGNVWDDADRVAKEFVANEGGYYCHPFDDPIVWSGHASMVFEIKEQLARAGQSCPSAVLTCAGGGGLLCGIIEGMHAVGWDKVPVIVMETKGAASFRAARDAGRPVAISALTSVATTLGALKVCQRAVDYIQEHPVISELVSDQQAVDACFRFADDHRMLVEPSSGATLAAIYDGVVSRLYREGKIVRTGGPLMVVVSGGSVVTLDSLQRWRETVNNQHDQG